MRAYLFGELNPSEGVLQDAPHTSCIKPICKPSQERRRLPASPHFHCATSPRLQTVRYGAVLAVAMLGSEGNAEG